MTYGWAGQVLKVDLTNRRIKQEPLEMEFMKTYLGARGFNSKTLFDLVKSKRLDPLSPGNILIFGVGPLTGTLSPSNGRMTVTAKSPITNAFGDSNVGGHFGATLKYAGYDQIVISGKSDTPVYLFIEDDEVSIRKANAIWGKNTWETQEIIVKELGRGIQTVCIGQAGENLVPYAAIVTGLKNTAGRCGMGAVMGSKNLKAIAVRGSKGVKIAKPELFLKSCREVFHEVVNAPYFKRRSRYGTALLMEFLNEVGSLSTRNYARPYFEFAEEIGGEALREKYTVKMRACFACPAHCTPYYYVKDGPYQGTLGEGPEFMTTGMLGSRCGNGDLASILVMNNLLNQYGIDVTAFGGVLGWAMDCYEKGILTEKDTGNLSLKWGDQKVMIELIHQTARREGFGAVLAEGETKAPKIIGKGSEKLMHTVKGASLIPEDPRSLRGFTLGYITSTRGADHLRADNILDGAGLIDVAVKLLELREAADPLTPKGKGKSVKWFEDFCAAIDSAGGCKFQYLQYMDLLTSPEKLARQISYATGCNLDGQGILEIGERIYNLEKAFNVLMGLSRKDDQFSVPDKFLKEPLKEGPFRNTVFELDEMLDEYYEARGWDVKTGLPGKKKLIKMGLGGIAKELTSKRLIRTNEGVKDR